MNLRFKLSAVLEDLRKLGLGLMLVGFIGLIAQKVLSAISASVLISLGGILWILGTIHWKSL